MKKTLIIMLAAAGIVFGLMKADFIPDGSFIVLAEEEVDGGEANDSKPPADEEKPEEKPEPQPDPEPKPEPKPKPNPNPKPEPKPDPKPNPKPKPKPSTNPKTDSNSTTNYSSKNRVSNSSGSGGKTPNSQKSTSTNQLSSQQQSEQNPVPHAIEEEPVIYEPEEALITESIEEAVEEVESEEALEEEEEMNEAETALDIQKLKQAEVMVRQEDGKFYVIYKDDDNKVVKQEITKEEAKELGYVDNEVVEKEDEQVDNIDLMAGNSNNQLKKIFGMIAVTLVSFGLLAGTYFYYRKKIA